MILIGECRGVLVNLILEKYSIDEALEAINNILKPASNFTIDNLIDSTDIDLFIKGKERESLIYIEKDLSIQLDEIFCPPLNEYVYLKDRSFINSKNIITPSDISFSISLEPEEEKKLRNRSSFVCCPEEGAGFYKDNHTFLEYHSYHSVWMLNKKILKKMQEWRIENKLNITFYTNSDSVLAFTGNEEYFGYDREKTMLVEPTPDTTSHEYHFDEVFIPKFILKEFIENIRINPQ